MGKKSGIIQRKRLAKQKTSLKRALYLLNPFLSSSGIICTEVVHTSRRAELEDKRDLIELYSCFLQHSFPAKYKVPPRKYVLFDAL